MEQRFNWKTKLFSKKFEIYQHDSLKGEIFKENWSRKVTGELNARRVRFETKGFFKNETSIIDLQGEIGAGKVIFAGIISKATIIYQNREYKWQFDNFLRSKWSVNDENGAIVRYHSNAFTGIITSYTRDEILILTGFFIRNFLKQRSAAIAAAS